MSIFRHRCNLIIIPSARRVAVTLAHVLLLGIVAGCSTAPEPVATTPRVAEGPGDARSIVWGKADQEPTEAINKWHPTADYLADHLSDVGINAGEMKIAPDSETLGEWIAAGEVDLVVDSFYPAMIASEKSGAVPLAVRSTGKPAKHAVFFARADADVKSLSDLLGKNIAFAEPDSTSGFMLPLAHLRQMGHRATEQPNPESAVNPQEVGYIFAGDDEVVATWVFEGRVIAGAVDNPTFEEFAAENPGELRVLAETGSISSANIVLIRKELEPAIASAVKRVLLEMDDTEEGRAILRETKTDRFDEYLQDVAADWEKTREQYLLIQD